MKKKCLLTALFGCMVVCASAQISLSGKVVDARTGKPVEGANVRLEQTTIGCATNPKGEFLLKDIKEGTYTLRTSCLNYQTGIRGKCLPGRGRFPVCGYA